MVAVSTSLPVIQCCAPLGGPALTDAEAGELETVFKALADRHRVKILNRLLSAGGEAVCVCEFEELLGLKQPTVSYHLKQLLTAGIVTREGAAPSPTSPSRPARSGTSAISSRSPSRSPPETDVSTASRASWESRRADSNR